MQAAVDFIDYPEGSVLFSMGATRVLCNVSVEQGVPRWMQENDAPGGWITAEYAMLPRATHSRSPRESIRPRARSQEIRRLIGRSLRAAFRLDRLPAKTCIVDCDVLQADGGTRTASISGGYIALAMALSRMVEHKGAVKEIFLPAVAAVSAGLLDGEPLLDLDYIEDSSAGFDLNVVINAEGSLIEVQGTAEGEGLDQERLAELLSLTQSGIRRILEFERETLHSAGVELPGEVWGM